MKQLLFTIALIVACLHTGYAQYSFEAPDWFRKERDLPVVELDIKKEIYVSDFYAYTDDNVDDSTGIANALAEAKSMAGMGNAVRVVFDEGVYDLDPQGGTHALTFNYGRYVELDGTGAKIMLHNPKVGFLKMYGSQNVIVKGFEVDYDPLPFTQGKVLSVDTTNRRFVMKVSAGIPYPDEPHIRTAPERWGMLKTADGMLKAGASNLLNLDTAYQINADTFQIVLLNKAHIRQVEVDDYYVQIARHNGRTIFQSNTGKNITYLNTKSYSSPAGTYNTFNHKEWNLIDCKILLKSGRVHSANADCIHISGGIIGPWVQGCRFEGQSDDAVNMKYAGLTITSVESPTQMTVQYSNELEVGDTVSFYNPREGVLIGRAGLVDTVQNLGGSSRRIFLSEPVYLENFNSDNSGDKAYLDTWACESFIFRDDTIRNSRRYGLLLQNGYGLIENCLFENLSGCAIRMENGVDWKEGFVVHDIEIKNNTFTNCGFDSKFEEDAYGASISAMISKLGDGACSPWCGTAISDWNGIQNIRISENTFSYNKASINFQNLKSEYLPDLDLMDGFTTYKIGLDSVFKDVLQGTLSFSTMSSETSVATVSVVSDSLQLTSEGDGLTKINITATNTNGGTAVSGFWLSVSGGSSSTRIFNGTESRYWNLPMNWEDEVPPGQGEKARIDADSSFVSKPYTLSQLSNHTTSSTTVVNGESLLTIDNNTSSGSSGILNNSSSASRLKLDVPVAIDNSVTSSFVYIQNSGNTDNIIEFGSNGSLTLNNRAILSSSANDPRRTFEFNGMLTGNDNLIFGAATTSVFGSTSDNSGFNADLIFWVNAEVTVDMLDDTTFLNTNHKIQINGDSAQLTVNAANCLSGNISIADAYTFTASIHENQSDLDQLLFAANGTLVLNLDPTVSVVHFEDNSTNDWNSGSVVINGFQNGVIRFGNNADGLTLSQCSKITVGGESPSIDSNGYLVILNNPEGGQITTTEVEDKTVLVNESFQLNLMDIFEDSNDSIFTYEYTAGNSDIIQATLVDDILTVTGLFEGESDITIEADNGFAQSKVKFSVNVAVPLSLDVDLESTVLYPNPLYGDVLKIKNLGEYAQELRVYNSSGQIRTTLKLNSKRNVEVPFKDAPSGMYLIDVIDSQGATQKTYRVIKN